MPLIPTPPAKVIPALVHLQQQSPQMPQKLELPIEDDRLVDLGSHQQESQAISGELRQQLDAGWMRSFVSEPDGEINVEIITVLTLWLICLFRYSQQRPIGIATQHTDGTARFIQVNLDPNGSFQTAWQQTYQQFCAASPTSSPLPQVVEQPTIGFQFRGTIPRDLNLVMDWNNTTGQISLHYHRDRFTPTYIQRLIGHWQTLGGAALADRHQSIVQLPLLTEPERDQILGEWSSKSQDLTPHSTIQAAFEAQVLRTPDAMALEQGDRAISYAELNAQANQLAHYLRWRGVQPDQLVGISLHRSPHLIVAMLGILKAGAAYLPLDPTYPQERRLYKIRDAQIQLILTEIALENDPTYAAIETLCLDGIWQTLQANYPRTNPAQIATAHHLAYVIYTSGSTGNPKGVMVEQRGLVNHASAMVQAFGLGSGDRMLQFSNIGFDIIVEEVYPTLISGATLVLRSEDLAHSTQSFWRFVQAANITILDLPTAFWHELVHGLVLHDRRPPHSLRLVVVGGEKASAQIYRQWKGIVGDRVRWLNTYGPTETTVSATLYEPEIVTDEMPIGFPLPNLSVYILDPQGQPVPVGVPGELHIGGKGVARGYLNLPEQTAAKFIPSPIDGLERLYRTGDLVQFEENGAISFIGRQDFQVKIRGFRIEPGEIEVQLLSHPQIQQAIVLAQEIAGNKQLIAYLVPSNLVPSNQADKTPDIQSFLASRLPHYMLPSRFEWRSALPLTANGKVDRTALSPSLSTQTTHTGTAQEIQLMDLWQEILGANNLNLESHFFDLGGHSLLVARLCDRLSFAQNRSIHPAAVFQNPTIGELAAWLDRPEPETLIKCFVPLQRGTGPNPPLFCIHVLGEGGQFFRPLAKELGSQQSVYGLAMQLMDRQGAPENQVEAIAAYYIQALRQIQPDGPYHLMGISYGGTVAYEMARQLLASGDRVNLVALLDTYGPGETTQADPERVKAHWQRLRQEGWHYGLRKAKRVSQRYRERLSRRVWQLAHRFGWNLSYAQQYELVLKENLAAADRYVPQPYPGEAILFRATQEVFYNRAYQDSGLGWQPLVKQLHQIDVPGNHLSIVAEPNVRLVADHLRDKIK
jgi:amino acid adenylation domain-containing protein